MSTSSSPKPRFRTVDECSDVYDLLGQIQLRPGMWIRGGSLRELEIMLWGYSMALQVHGIDESAPFRSNGDFSEWLRKRFGWSTSLGWAHAMEENAGEELALDLFFRLADESRLDHLPGPRG